MIKGNHINRCCGIVLGPHNRVGRELRGLALHPGQRPGLGDHGADRNVLLLRLGQLRHVFLDARIRAARAKFRQFGWFNQRGNAVREACGGGGGGDNHERHCHTEHARQPQAGPLQGAETRQAHRLARPQEAALLRSGHHGDSTVAARKQNSRISRAV